MWLNCLFLFTMLFAIGDGRNIPLKTIYEPFYDISTPDDIKFYHCLSTNKICLNELNKVDELNSKHFKIMRECSFNLAKELGSNPTDTWFTIRDDKYKEYVDSEFNKCFLPSRQAEASELNELYQCAIGHEQCLDEAEEARQSGLTQENYKDKGVNQFESGTLIVSDATDDKMEEKPLEVESESKEEKLTEEQPKLEINDEIKSNVHDSDELMVNEKPTSSDESELKSEELNHEEQPKLKEIEMKQENVEKESRPEVKDEIKSKEVNADEEKQEAKSEDSSEAEVTEIPQTEQKIPKEESKKEDSIEQSKSENAEDDVEPKTKLDLDNLVIVTAEPVTEHSTTEPESEMCMINDSNCSPQKEERENKEKVENFNNQPEVEKKEPTNEQNEQKHFVDPSYLFINSKAQEEETKNVNKKEQEKEKNNEMYPSLFDPFFNFIRFLFNPFYTFFVSIFSFS